LVQLSWEAAAVVIAGIGLLGLLPILLEFLGYSEGVGAILGHTAEYNKNTAIQAAILNARYEDQILVLHHVPRPEYDDLISPFVSSPPFGIFLVVSGARGTGKSTAVAFATQNKSSVIYLSAIHETDGFFSLLVKRTGLDSDAGVIAVAAAFRKAHTSDGIAPTIILDVSMRGERTQIVKDAAIVAKRLAVDSRAANVIILMSDNNAANGLPDDGPRRNMICVGDFTLEQAHQYADLVGLLSGQMKPLRSMIFDIIGTRPADLAVMRTKTANITRYIEKEVLAKAELTLRNFLKGDLEKRVINELLPNLINILISSESGCVHANNITSQLDHIILADYQIRMQRHAVLFDECQELFCFQSQAIRHVAINPAWRETSLRDLGQLEIVLIGKKKMNTI
jgi:hypothetical protein